MRFAAKLGLQRLALVGSWAACMMAACVSGLATTPAQADENPNIRSLPYPFSHVVSFSSDVDMQRPWHGAAMHRVFNEELGLTISDSLWPQGSEYSSALFLGPSTMNRTPSGVGTQPTFALLLREWHRGNIDHFHSWQEDGVLQARTDIEPPLALTSARVSYELPPVHQTLREQNAQNFRLYFSAPPPLDLTIVVHDAQGRSLSLPVVERSRGENIQLEVGTFGWIVEVIIPRIQANSPPVRRSPRSLVEEVIPQLRAGSSSLAVSPMQINRIELIAPSCAAGCNTNLIRIERDHFSRQTVLAQLPWLEQWNIRPALITSHGGNTLIQNYGIKGRTLELPRTEGTFLADKSTVVSREPLADRKESHAYHSDILRRLSVLGVWPYYPAVGTDLFRPASTGKADIGWPALTTSYSSLYNVPRTIVVVDNSNEDAFAESLRKIAPDMPVETRRRLYCGVACTADQGDALPLLISQSIYLIDAGEKVRHFWYSHFGSGSTAFKASPEQPLTPNVLLWMRRLANLIYDFDRSVGEQRRVWSPPANSWLRYQIMKSGVQKHVKIGESGSDVEITPWQDAVTQITMPDLLASTRDLHGLTIYVADPDKASIHVAGREVHSFTRNPPDASGRGSVTIVDDNTPTSLIGPIALQERGGVEVLNGDFQDVVPGRDYVSLIADAEGRAQVAFTPWQLELWNISHIQLAFRKLRATQGESMPFRGGLKIELSMDDGGTIALAEAPQLADPSSSTWLLANTATNEQWQRVTLDVARLAWPDVKLDEANWRRPPLPIGRVRKISISLAGARAGERIDIGELLAFRPSGNGEAPGGAKLVAGRVTTDGLAPAALIPVEAESEDGEVATTATDKDGYYFFPGRKRNEKLAIQARIDSATCRPLQGRKMVVTRNDPEVDILLSHCHN